MSKTYKTNQESQSWLPCLVFLAGIALTLLIWFSVRQNLRLKTRSDFETAVQQISSELNVRMEAYIALLRGGAGLYAVNRWVTDDEFHAYADRLRIRDYYPGIQAFAVAMKVTPDTRLDFLKKVRAQGAENFRIWPEGSSHESFPITYLEPMDARNEAALGFDMFSEPVRHEAMTKARDEGEPIATRRVTLVQEITGQKQPGFLVYVPFYGSGEVPTTVEARRRESEGFVYSAFRAHDLLNNVLARRPAFPVDIEIFDGTNAVPDNLLYSYTSAGPQKGDLLENIQQIEVAGRKWTLHFTSRAQVSSMLYAFLPLIPVVGFLSSFLLFFLVNAEARSRRKFERTAEELAVSETELRQRREWLQVTLSSIADAVIATDITGKVEFLNGVAETMTGWKEAEAIGKPLEQVLQIVQEKTRERCESPVAKVIREQATVGMPNDVILISRSGQERAIDDSAAPIRDSKGTLIGVVIVFHDVTKQRKAEEFRARQMRQIAVRAEVSGALATAAVSQQQILEQACEAVVRHLGIDLVRIWIFVPESNVLELQASAGLYQHTNDEFSRVEVGKLNVGRIAQERRPFLNNDFQNSEIADNQSWAREQGMQAFAGYPLLAEGRLIGVFALFSKKKLSDDTLNDLASITDLLALGLERKRIENALRASEELHRTVTATASDGIVIIDEHSKILSVNPAVERIFGYKVSELTGQTLTMLMPARYHAAHFAGMKRFIETGESRIAWSGVELPGLHKDKHEIPLEISFGSFEREGKHFFTGVIRDISSRKKSEAALRASEEEFRSLFEVSSVGQAQADLQNNARFTRVNARFCEITGYSPAELLEKNFTNITHPDDLAATVQNLRRMVKGEITEYSEEKRYIRKDGSIVWVSTTVRGIPDPDGKIRRSTAVIQDITSRRDAEQALRQSQRELQTIADSVPVIIGKVDNQCRYIFNNRTYEKWFHLSPEKIRGMHIRELIGEQAFNELRPHVDKALRGKPAGFEGNFHFPSGARFVEGAYLPHFEEGKVVGIFVCMSDLSERKRAEDASRFLAQAGRVLAESLNYERTFSNVVRIAVPDMADWCAIDILTPNDELRRLKVAHSDAEKTKRAEELARRYPPERDSEPFAEVFRTGKSKFVPELSDEMLVQGARNEEHLKMLRELGLRSLIVAPIKTREKVYGAITLVMAESGRNYTKMGLEVAEELAMRAGLAMENALLYEEAHREIAERRAVEQALRESEEKFRLVVERARDYAIFMLDAEGRVSNWNPGAERILGYTEKEILGRDGSIIFTIEDRESGAPQRELHTAIESGQALDERWHRRKDGSRFFASGYMISLRDDAGNLRGFAKIMRDVTERKNAEESIRKLNQELELRVERRTAALQESYEQMETFTYTVAHDLRAPLRAMQGFATALQEEYGEKIDEVGQDFLNRIVRASRRMDSLIKDLLSYSQLSRSDLRFERVSLDSTIESVLGSLAEDVRNKNATVTVESPLPDVTGHRSTLEHVFTNIISNGMKFVAPGVNPKIRIRAEQRNNGNQKMVRLWFEDNGIGIAPEYQGRIFRLFERLHGADSYPGTGMGLALVKKGIERMNGQVGLESEAGKGSRFWIELPAA